MKILFQLNAGNFDLEYAGENDKSSLPVSITENIGPSQRLSLGVINVLNPKIETHEEVHDTIPEVIVTIPVNQFGATDDCGFSPFADDTSPSRDTALQNQCTH